MALIKAHGNKSTEHLLANILRAARFKGWRRQVSLFGTPDFAFPSNRLAIFIDGCFWHGCAVHCRLPSSNVAYWRRKITRNKARDRLVTQTLKNDRWRVLRIWEHELRFPRRLLRRVARALNGN